MNTKTTPNKELTVTERANKALAAVTTEQALLDLAGKYTDLTAVKDKTDLDLAMSALGELRSTRVEIQKAGKAARDDANAFSKAVITEEKRLIGIIAPEESRIKKLREDYEAEIERQRAEKARIEAERVAGIRARIARFHDTVTAAANGPSEHLQKVIERLDAVTIGDEYQEMAGEAMVAVAQARNRARELHAAAVAREQAEAERQAREAAEAEARRKEAEELARQRAEQARIAAELKAQQEAIERERREAEAEARAEQEERERQAAAERAEIERQRRELAERQAEIDRRERAKAEAARAEQERKAAEERAAQEKATAKTKPVTLEQGLVAWANQYAVPEEALEALIDLLVKHGVVEPQEAA